MTVYGDVPTASTACLSRSGDTFNAALHERIAFTSLMSMFNMRGLDNPPGKQP